MIDIWCHANECACFFWIVTGMNATIDLKFKRNNLTDLKTSTVKYNKM